jgi:DNA polymerase I-like protein with 3'-5' exonuclease and polymerase domains
LLAEINSPDPRLSAQAERQAVNSIVQGSASDLIKSAMLLVDNALSDRAEPHSHEQTEINSSSQSTAPADGETMYVLRSPRLLLQIHDELIFEVPLAAGREPAQVLQGFVALLREQMERLLAEKFCLSVPLIVNVQIGENWGEMKPYGEWQTNDK